MPLSSSLQISASGLTAERFRLDVISNNIANANTPGFRRQQVVFGAREAGSSFASHLNTARGQVSGAGMGVEVASVRPDLSTDFKMVKDPGNPAADKDGFVKMPNVEPVIEMVDLIGSSRAYEAGVTAINAAKQMEQRALDIGRA